jgi:hypothetical protein
MLWTISAVLTIPWLVGLVRRRANCSLPLRKSWSGSSNQERDHDQGKSLSGSQATDRP